jgi:hypothetical protein
LASAAAIVPMVSLGLDLTALFPPGAEQSGAHDDRASEPPMKARRSELTVKVFRSALDTL